MEDDFSDLDVTLNDGLDEIEESEEWEEEYDGFDLNKDGILDKDELKAKEDSLLNDPSVSAWRRNLIRKKRKNEGDDLTKTY